MGKKIKFKVNRLKFKMMASHIEAKKISGETKITLYKTPGEKVVFESEGLTFELGTFRQFLNDIEPMKSPNTSGNATLSDESGRIKIILLTTEESSNDVKWRVQIDETIDTDFIGDRNELYTISSDIAPFVINPVGF